MIRPLPGALILGGCLLATGSSFAQQGPTDNGNGTANTSGASTTPAATTTVYPGLVAPPEDGAPIGGGNATESSSRPVTGDKEDTFDNLPPSDSGGTVYGGKNAGFFDNRSGPTRVMGAQGGNPSVHTVQKGETLWSICDSNFQNAYQWPRIWSYNPQIQNPHWIYPDEQIRLKPGISLSATPQVTTPGEGGGVPLVLQRRIAPDTVFLREEGYVNEDSGLNWGSIVGSPQDKMFLSDTDQAYVRIGPDHDVKLGEELTVFRPIRNVSDGQVISIQGTIRVDDWNPQTRIARAQIVETLDAIERGARVGPVPRRFEVIPPVRDDANVTAHVLIASHPHMFFGQEQLVFIDQGSESGLKPGNRLFVVRHGDAWWQAQVTSQTSRRIVGEREEPAVVENLPPMASANTLPEEVVAELRVLNVQKKSSTCIVSQSAREVELNDVAVARKGY